jgi:hypothetical protein
VVDEPIAKEEEISKPLVIDATMTKEPSSELTSPPKADVPMMSKLSLGNIANIRESIIKSEAILVENRKSLSVEKLREIWSKYKENQSSKSLQMALHYVLLSLDAKTLHIAVPNQLAKDMILQESDLIDQLRLEGGERSLLFNIEIDKSQFPDYEDAKPTQAVVTQKDKYMQYLELNPSLGLLTSELGLKLDSELN